MVSHLFLVNSGRVMAVSTTWIRSTVKLKRRRIIFSRARYECFFFLFIDRRWGWYHDSKLWSRHHFSHITCTVILIPPCGFSLSDSNTLAHCRVPMETRTVFAVISRIIPTSSCVKSPPRSPFTPPFTWTSIFHPALRETLAKMTSRSFEDILRLWPNTP